MTQADNDQTRTFKSLWNKYWTTGAIISLLLALGILFSYISLNDLINGKAPEKIKAYGYLFALLITAYKTAHWFREKNKSAHGFGWLFGILQIGLIIIPLLAGMFTYNYFNKNCAQPSYVVHTIAYEFVDSCEQWARANLTMQTMGKDHTSIDNSLQKYQQAVLSAIMDKRGISQNCRKLFSDTLNRVAVLFATAIRQKLERLEQCCEELNQMMAQKNIQGIIGVFRKYNIAWDAKAVEWRDSTQLIGRGRLRSYLRDVMQQLMPETSFKAVWLQVDHTNNNRVTDLIFIKS